MTTSPSRLDFRFKALILVVLTGVFTALCLRTSSEIGRLATAPNYDDVVYFQEGALLLTAIQSGDLGSFFNERGLHSPYSIGLAAIAYGVLGFRDMAPYAASGIVVLAYLAGIAWFLRRLPIGVWVPAVVLFLTPPFVTMGVVEFRPDIAWAVVTGFGAVFIVSSDSIFRHPGRAALAGLCFALSLTIKPSTFVMTLLLYMGAVFSRLVAGVWMAWRAKQGFSFPWRGTLAAAGVSLLVAGPYWLTYGKNAIAYFLENSFGTNKEVWVYRGTTWEFFSFYLTGEGARSNIAISGLVLLALVLPCLVLLIWKRPELRWKLFMLAFLIAGAFLVNTVAQMKSPFLGGGIYGVLFFSCAYVVGEAARLLLSAPSRTFSWVIAGVVCLVAVTAVCFYRWPEYSNWGMDRSRITNYREANIFMNKLLDSHAERPPESIFFMQAGPVVMEYAGLWFPKHGLKSPAGSGAFLRSVDEFRNTYPSKDWIVIQEQGVMGASLNMPSEAFLPEFLEILRADPRFQVIGEYTALDGRKVWVFAQKH